MKKKILVLFLACLFVFSPFSGMNISAAGDELSSSYGYDETPAKSVTVTVTISNDGIPIMGEGNVPLANLEVTVPYFDLEKYELQDFYRYSTEDGQGDYTGVDVVERPTLLHLYIYLLERYYMGLDEEDCGKGDSGVVGLIEDKDVYYFDEDLAYTSYNNDYGYNIHNSALYITGSATSLYMSNFWGHDENLMYYRNHRYPLMSEGWGATADYILLSDGDRIDLAMFTNWSFWNEGAFLCFDRDEYTASAGTELTVKTLSTATSAAWDGSETPVSPYTGETTVALYDKNWNKVDVSITVEGEGSYVVALPETAGTYYLMASDVDAKTEDAALAPATAKIVVEDSVVYGDVNGDGKVNSVDAMLVYAYHNGKTTFTEEQMRAADVDGNGKVNSVDATYVYAYHNGKITTFPVEE